MHLQSYIAPYTGHNRLNRLVFIAERSVGTPLELEALRLAHDEVKKVGFLASTLSDLRVCGVVWPMLVLGLQSQTENTQLYSVITERIAGRLGSAYNFDKWVLHVCCTHLPW
jgi:COP9 signalosome complex subunit 1